MCCPYVQVRPQQRLLSLLYHATDKDAQRYSWTLGWRSIIVACMFHKGWHHPYHKEWKWVGFFLLYIANSLPSLPPSKRCFTIRTTHLQEQQPNFVDTNYNVHTIASIITILVVSVLYKKQIEYEQSSDDRVGHSIVSRKEILQALEIKAQAIALCSIPILGRRIKRTFWSANKTIPRKRVFLVVLVLIRRFSLTHQIERPVYLMKELVVER